MYLKDSKTVVIKIGSTHPSYDFETTLNPQSQEALGVDFK